jgi:hypothetical protein
MPSSQQEVSMTPLMDFYPWVYFTAIGTGDRVCGGGPETEEAEPQPMRLWLRFKLWLSGLWERRSRAVASQAEFYLPDWIGL